MSIKNVAALIASSLALGVGLGLAIGDKPFVLEATATPFGTFVLRYNPVPDPLPPALQEPLSPWHNYIA